MKSKLSIKIIVFVVISTVIGTAILSAIAAFNIFKLMKQEAVTELRDTVTSNVKQLDRYVDKLYAYMDGYLSSDKIENLKANQDDEAALAEAQKWTEKYVSVVPGAINIFFANADAKFIADSMPQFVGYENPPEMQAMFREIYTSGDGSPMYGITAVISDATGQSMVTLAISCSTYINKEYVGFAGIEVNRDEFYELFEQVQITDNQEVILTSTRENPTVYYSTNPDEVSYTSENPVIVDLVEKIKNGDDKFEDIIHYTQAGTGKEMLGYYRYLPEQDWLMFVGAEEDELYADASSASRMIVAIGVVIIIIITVILTIIIGIMIKPISKVERAISRVANHDISKNKDIDVLSKRSDEIGILARSTQKVIDTLNDAVGLFKNCSGSLNESSNDLNKASSLLGEVTTDNRNIADNLSVKINETSDSIESIHEEIENIVSLVNTVTEKVEVSEEDSQKLIDSTHEINEKIDGEMEMNMATLQQTTASMQEALESLKAVEQINALAEDIMSITSQTNLLSLNASIEAARAGEAGKGFAVVAGEIGQLADQSKETAMNITEIVSESNKSVTNVREQVTKLIDYIKNDVMSSFGVFQNQSKNYDEGVLGIKKAIKEIGEAMESLNESIEEIARRISSVNNASIENTEGVTSILGKNAQATDVSTNIEKLAESSRSNAESLKSAINQFKLDEV